MSEKKGLLDSMSPSQTFGVGLVGGILILCTIGFFILLKIVLGGGVELGAGAPAIGNQPTAPSPSHNGGAPTAEISIRDIDKNDHIKGDRKAKVTIVEYSDLECPFCKRFHQTMQQVVDKYDDKDVAWVYRHFPLDTLHRKARPEAIATECAAEQGKFWELTDLIVDRTTSNDGLDLSKLSDYAAEIGLNVSKFETCLDSEEAAKRVQEDADDAVAAGGRGTPYSIILGPDGETIPLSGAQPLSAIEAAIAQFL